MWQSLKIWPDRQNRIWFLLVLAACWGASSCSEEDTPMPAGPEESGFGAVSFSFRLSKVVAAELSRAEVIITGPGMEEIRQELSISGNAVTGVVRDIPAGRDRLFTINGYDAGENLIFSGSEPAEVIANQRVQVFILMKRTGGPVENEITVSTPASTAHEMVLVPAGEFTMGLTAEQDQWIRQREWWYDWMEDTDFLEREQPAHTVHLDTYYIDKYEVTNAQYVAFLNAFGSNTGSEGIEFLNLEDENVQIRRGRRLTGSSSPGKIELISPELANLPVMEVSWYGAKAYCEWMGGRLPTEAEWEKAARGTDGRIFPWGGGLGENKAYYIEFMIGESPWNKEVGSYPEGVSPYGAYDMAGNVDEWVADWFDSGYYARSPSHNPQGPPGGEWRVMRGGSWYGDTFFLHTSARGSSEPARWNFSIGFRCARDQ